jgi:hypothetical protein
MELLKTGGEGGSDFGPFGTFSCLTAGFILLGRPTKDILWRIAAAGLASMLLVCATTSWMPWNMRFLLLPFLLFSLVTVILFTSETAAGTQGRIVLLALLLFSAVAFPLYSLNKGPKDLWLSVKDRRAMITKERSAMLEILQDLEARQAEIGSAPILLSAGDDSWVLPILQLRNLHVIPFPQIDRPRLRQFSSQQGRLSVYILTLNRPLGPDCHAVPVKTYGEQDSALFSWPVLEPIATLNSQTNALTFVFASGWHQVEYDGQDWSCWTDGRGRVMVQAARDMVVALTGEIHSAQRPNHVDVLVNGAKVDTLTINWTEWAFHPFSPVRVEFKAGENFMDFVSQNPAVTLQHDPRSLAIAVRNLAFATEK